MTYDTINDTDDSVYDYDNALDTDVIVFGAGIDAQDISRFEEWVDVSTLRRVDVRHRPNDWQSLQRLGALRQPPEIRAELERRAKEARAQINLHQE